jgi:hypothetical protein
MALQCISPEVIVKCCKKCCIPNAMDDSVLGMSVRKMKPLNVKMETVTLIGKGR